MMGKLFAWMKKHPVLARIGMFLSIMGPGIITANVDNDAGGITTYSMAGAHFGYTLIWSLVPITIALIIVQEMCARMAVVTGKGLADLIRENFGVKVTFYLMLILFLVNLGNVIAEFAGVAASMEIFGVSKYISVPLAAMFVWFLVVRGNYKTVEKVFLIACLFYLSYIISGMMAKPNWHEVLEQSIKPQIQWNLDYIVMLVGLVGTTIAPWMQFYQQASTVEKGLLPEDYHWVRLDVVVGCVIAPLVAGFIIIACAATLHHGGVHIHSAQDAAVALQPFAGIHATWLFALGLLIASLFAASILPLSTAYSICEGMGWDVGVDKRFEDAPQFFGLYTTMIVIGAAVVLWPQFPLWKVMYFSQVGNGVLLPFVLIYMLKLVNNKDIMGQYVNSRWLNIIAISTVAIVIVLTLVMVMFMLVNGQTP